MTRNWQNNQLLGGNAATAAIAKLMAGAVID